MEKNDTKKIMAAEKEKILKYLQEQLELKLDALKAMETPIDMEAIKDIRKMEELILKREIFDLKRHIQVIRML